MQSPSQGENGGPLLGVRVVGFEGAGSISMCAMVLADLGASVICVTRPGESECAIPGGRSELRRGKILVELDLRTPGNGTQLDPVIGQADVVMEGFRPGVIERLGFGPTRCLSFNQGLVFARLTGWANEGPWRTSRAMTSTSSR